MAGSYASEKNAIANCDRCGFRYKLSKLRKETKNLNRQNLRVCPDCWDSDHPQNKLGRVDFQDNQALRDPRPDLGLEDSRFGDAVKYEFDSITGWTGNNASLTHDSENGYLNQAWTVESFPSFQIDTAAIDASEYVNVRARVRSNDWASLESQTSWLGNFYWNRTTDGASFSDDRLISLNRPMFSMGEQFNELLWSMRGVTDWDGTVSRMRFLIWGSANNSTGSIDVDWIRVEKVIK